VDNIAHWEWVITVMDKKLYQFLPSRDFNCTINLLNNINNSGSKDKV
jgi:hypothetical protein